jgi:F0F1-type ATP synthase membrane subunit a
MKAFQSSSWTVVSKKKIWVATTSVATDLGVAMSVIVAISFIAISQNGCNSSTVAVTLLKGTRVLSVLLLLSDCTLDVGFLICQSSPAGALVRFG